MTTTPSWQQRIGHQRDWAWRGWQTRYTFIRGKDGTLTAAPMVFLHGFGASIGHWRSNLSVFSQTRTVYALDLLGFGASEKVSTEYLITLWVEQVHDFWQTFIRTPIVLVGNSLGSLVGLTAASLYPEMVEGLSMLTLPDSSVLENPQWIKPAIAPLKLALRPLTTLAIAIFTSPPIFTPFFRFIRRPALIRSWAQKAYCDSTAVEDDLVDILSSPAYDVGAASALLAMVKTMTTGQVPQHTAKEMLPQLSIPILIVWGQQDLLIPPKLGPLFARCNPLITLVELDKAGHCPHDECPDRLNPILLNWLDRHLPGVEQPSTRLHSG